MMVSALRVVLGAYAVNLGAALRSGSRVFVLGPGAVEVKLIAAKTAAKQGFATSVVALGPDSEKAIRRAENLMYGKREARETRRCAVVSGGDLDAVGAALTACEGLVLCCDEKSGALSEPFVRVCFDVENSPKLKKVSLLSRLGGGGGGFLGGKALGANEAAVRAACESRGVPLTIVRAGVLKGGGPGKLGKTGQSEYDFGLDKAYYDTLFELTEAMSVMSHDQFAFGGAVRKGDPYKIPNPLQLAMTSGDFEPHEYDCNRVVVAGALVAALSHESGPFAEYTVSSLSAEEPPTPADWSQLLKTADRA